MMSQQQFTLEYAAGAKGRIPPKPKRPLTIFNLFSILERNFIVQQSQKQAHIPPNASTDIHTDPYLATRPQRYRDVVLPSNWYVVGMNRVKRSKHKVHGVISFKDLTKEISNRWKLADAETKKYCEMIAADELERYRRDMAAYEAMYGKDTLNGQKRSHRKHSVNVDTADKNGPINGYVDMKGAHCLTCTPLQAQTYASNSGDTKVTTNTACSRNHSPTLSDYLPDDKDAALALVGNNYDNILHGEELEKAFDSD